MTSFDVANNSVAMVDWHSPHAKRQVMENIQRFADAYVQEKVAGKHHEGACWMLDAIIGSLRGYPDSGGDIQVMTEVQRIVAEAVLAEHQKVCPTCLQRHLCHLGNALWDAANRRAAQGVDKK